MDSRTETTPGVDRAQDQRAGAQTGAPGGGTGAKVAGAEVVTRLRAAFDSGLTRPLEWRRAQLRRMKDLLREGEKELLDALRTDLGKSPTEAWVTELAFVATEVDVMLSELDHWTRPEKVKLPVVQRPGRATIVREPLGVALVIAPWNYPVHLLLLPMAAAISAGNAVVGKPSEVTPATSAALARLVPRYLDDRAVAVVEGGVAETQDLLAQRFDHVFYTGNGTVGRVVMEAAAAHLTPVTLELGGKSPAIVAADADIDVAARRIAWGKFVNAGQTCVAPDYVLVDRRVEDRLVQGIRSAIRRYYGSDPRSSDDYSRIVNERHARRLAELLEASRQKVVAGGEVDISGRYIAPTVLRDVGTDEPVMREEIFGPILPVLGVDSVDEAVKFVNARPKPLALYVFSGDKDAADDVVANTSSGGVCVNHTVVQLGVPGLPFGGVGASGTGAYHGRHGFETFSHRRAVLSKPFRPDPSIAYPPYSRFRRWILRRVLAR